MDFDRSSKEQLLSGVIRSLETKFYRFADETAAGLFDGVIDSIIELTDGSSAILFEIVDQHAGYSYLNPVAISFGLSMSPFYRELPAGEPFYDRDSLLSTIVSTGDLVIANDATVDVVVGGTSGNHPPVSSFIGIPLHLGSKMMGALVMMNRDSGYDRQLADFLHPLCSSCAHILFSKRNDQRRMEMEKQLKESVSRISAIVDTVVDGILTINDKGIVETFNPAAEQIFGYVAKEVIGRNVSLLMPDHFREEHDSYLGNYFETGERKVIGIGREVVGRRRDGTTFPLELSVSEMQIGESRVFTGIVRDISERKESEEALRENVARISAIVETVVDGIVMIDSKGVIESFNPAAEKIFGYRAREVIGRNVSMLMPEPYHEGHDSYLDHYHRTGEKKVIGIGREVEGRRKNGSTFPLELAVSEMWIGDQRMFTGIVRDVTERKEAETKLRDSAARIEAIVDTVVDGILTINEHGVIESLNPAAEKIFGYLSDEIVGRNVSMLMPDPYHDEHDGYLENYRRTGDRKVIGIGREVVGLHKDGSTFPLELSVSEMWLGEQRMFTGIVRDITERKNIETLKNEFISTVSHELRTPLTSIRGSLGLVANGAVGELPEKALEMMTIAETNSCRLLGLINDILDIEKIAAGKMVFNFVKRPLLPIIEQAIVANEAYGKQYSISFCITACRNDLIVNVDADRLLQVLSNFMSNGAKFSPPGGRVEIAANCDGNTVRIAVRDSGEGVPEEFQGEIFQKFSQAEFGNRHNRKGTGLGLAISKEIVEKMGGSVGFVTEAGEGTTFYCDLPSVVGYSEEVLAENASPQSVSTHEMSEC